MIKEKQDKMIKEVKDEIVKKEIKYNKQASNLNEKNKTLINKLNAVNKNTSRIARKKLEMSIRKTNSDMYKLNKKRFELSLKKRAFEEQCGVKFDEIE